MYKASIELSQETDTRKIFNFFIEWGMKNSEKATLICDRQLLDSIVKKMERNNITTVMDEITEGSNCLVLEINCPDEEVLSTKWIKSGKNRMILESIEILSKSINLKGKAPLYVPSSKSWTEELIVFLY